MIALNSECVLVEDQAGELTPRFPEDITPEMLGMREVDRDYFAGAVEAVFAYINRDCYLGRVTEEMLSDLVSAALVTPPGKLVRHIKLSELIPSDSLCGELGFYQKLKEVLLELEGVKADLIFVEDIKNCTLACLHRQRWSKESQKFANSVVEFIRCFCKTTSNSDKILVVE